MTSPLTEFRRAATEGHGQVRPLLDVLERLDPGALLPLPGGGRTAERLRGLAAVAEADVTAARVLEPHVDAVAILAEAGHPSPPVGTTWGVFAAEAPDAVLNAALDDGRWTLTGLKPWCSLAGELSDALVTATTDDGEGRMFAVRLRQPGVVPQATGWIARGLAEVTSAPVRFDGVTAEPVGAPGWYLSRAGFRHGAVGVAACWWGGCLPLAAAVLAKARSRPDDALPAARVGALYRRLRDGRAALQQAAEAIDGRVRDADPGVVAHAVRGTVADAVLDTLAAVRDLLGPAVLAFDEEAARRSADLELYVSQYHRGRDDASLAARLTERDLAW